MPSQSTGRNTNDLTVLSDAELDAVAGGFLNHSFNGAVIQIAYANASQTNVNIDGGQREQGGDSVAIAKNVNFSF